MTATTISDPRHAVENRDAASLEAMYADDAVLTIIDTDNPPSRPRTINDAPMVMPT
jgi:ketosteroid isomerase-like protein